MYVQFRRCVHWDMDITVSACWFIIINSKEVHRSSAYFSLAKCHFMSVFRQEVNAQIFLWKYTMSEKNYTFCKSHYHKYFILSIIKCSLYWYKAPISVSDFWTNKSVIEICLRNRLKFQAFSDIYLTRPPIFNKWKHKVHTKFF